MEVTNARDFVTHAVIGGHGAQAVGMDDSPEFMHVLSSTLYRDKPLAVVREVLCNAWDAHIEAGIMSMAIDVTLTSEKFIIRDYGEGISRTMIQPVYGIYGRSTKKKNANVTGGFGLGSKSPWAYTDHFQVTSFHAGEKTVYNMSKSSAQVQGKPMITPLLTIPTDESGLEVSINIVNRHDFHTFTSLIRRIAALGEMKVRLNGELLKVVPFSSTEDGYLFVKRELIGNQHHKIFVRYGHVVYPVDDHDLYNNELNQAVKFLRRINDYNVDTWCVVMYAKPSTLSITPSRESLSMTDQSAAVIKELLTHFNKRVDGVIDRIVFPLNSQMIQSLPPMSPPSKLLTVEKTLVDPKALPGKANRPYISNVEQLGAVFMRRTYPIDITGFREADLKERLDTILHGQFGHQRLVKSFYREVSNSWKRKIAYRTKDGKRVKVKHNKTWKWEKHSNWVHRQVLWPIMRGFMEAGLDNRLNNLFVFEGTSYTRRPPSKPGAAPGPYGTWAQLTLFKHFEKQPFLQSMLFTRGLAIVGHNRADIEDRVKNFPMIKNWFGDAAMSIACLIPRNYKKGTAKEAIAVFEKLGFTVLDLTRFHSWEKELAEEFEEKIVERKTAAPKAKKKKLTGFPILSQAVVGESLSADRLYAEEAERLDDPEFVVSVPYREELERISNWGPTASIAIARSYGHRGVVVRSVTQEAKALEKYPNARLLDRWIMDQILELYKTDPTVEEYYRNSARYLENEHGRAKQYARIVRLDDKLRKKFKLPDRPSQLVRDSIVIFESRNDRWTSWPHVKEIRELIAKWKSTPELIKLLSIVRGNQLHDFVDLDEIEKAMRISVECTRKSTAREILLLTMKGEPQP